MNKRLLKLLSAVILILPAASLSSCGKNEESSDDVASFTYLLAKGEDSIYYSDYGENPVIKYMLGQKWNNKTLDIDFYAPAAGSEKDQFNTIIASGDYYDIMDLSYSNYSARELYEDEVLIDLTDLVTKYCPNYLKRIESNDELKAVAYSDIDGEKKIIQLFSTYDVAQTIFEGYSYRRDWIVKYGENPSTHAKFTSGYTDPDDVNTYYDDVKFPSWYGENKDWYVTNVDPTWDGSCPVFISDWEWMFDIFQKAMKELNITDGYCYSPYYVGYQQTGDLFSGFGGGTPLWSKDGTSCTFNATGESMKSYLECLSTWYQKGYINKTFNERSSDMFYQIDTAKVHQGKVGLIQSVSHAFDLRDDAYEYTKESVLYGARQPINDIYGDDSTKLHIPDGFYAFSKVGGSIGITEKAKEKDLATLLTWFDYLYSDEGGTFARTGFTAEQVEEYNIEFYKRYGLDDGIYTKKEDGIYYVNKKALETANLISAAYCNRLAVGYNPNAKIVDTSSDIMAQQYKEWGFYESTTYINSTLNQLMEGEESSTYSKVLNNINTYLSQNLPLFIKGTKTVEKDFADFAATVNKYGPSKVTKIYQRIFDSIYN